MQPQRVNPNNKHRVFQHRDEKSKRQAQLRKERRAHTGEKSRALLRKGLETQSGSTEKAGSWELAL